MARPPRRRPTLPDHDPRAIRAVLRREVYAIGDARRHIDSVEFEAVGGFVALPLARPPGLDVIVNGASILDEIRRRPVPLRLQYLPDSSLRDREGTREVYLTNCSCGILACGGERVLVHVTGRYVVWQTRPELFGAPLVFDRASYRESLEAAIAEPCYGEDDASRSLREVLSQAEWGGAHEAGLKVVDAHLTGTSFTVMLHDPLWHTRIEARVPWPAVAARVAVASIVCEIARWDLRKWSVRWWPPARHPEVRPPYPAAWHKVVTGVAGNDGS